MADPSPAPRGTRPRDRRAQILAAATRLFAERGYARVGMGDIAEAVGVGPSALYRHFSGKPDVLSEVVGAGLSPVLEGVRALPGKAPADAAAAMASFALDQRHVGLMWQRESRNLPPEERRRHRDVIRAIGAGLAAYIRAVRPGETAISADVRAWALLSVLTSPAFHRLDPPRHVFEKVLARLADTVLTAELPPIDPDARTPPRAGLRPVTRREELLNQAVRMFAAHGYSGVSIEDVGRAVGIAGPSVYNHWASKLDLLIATMWRGVAALATDAATAYRLAVSPADGLDRLLCSYVALSQAQPEIFGLVITDIDHLPDDHRHKVRRSQHEYVTEWTHLLRLHRPDLDDTPARITVHATLSLAHDLARTPHLRANPTIPPAITTLSRHLLTLPPT
ncbi:TetR/AcrR family transcriptional regulator [Actinocorallia sp. A-T 12471]|uniref:TetR/AcrR family transcriptional regulator n=1 Tax=Actinocorallia sp. A-T 12471 TaxID=3089813 RepID=UPI0029CD2A36|nr:TetR/AcrR family transcriptional regulator [Actinocorallia sp. A-T 12471]MDX6740715.1 TetR/AcrR family transcriptional regulator [Actinocorallia sp. A-T 12471]